MRKLFALASTALIMVVPFALLTGCGTIHFGLDVIERPDGVEVQNVTSDFAIRVHKVGGLPQGYSPMIQPGDPTPWIVDTKNLENYDIIVAVKVDAFHHGVFVGTGEHKYQVPRNRACNETWSVHDSDLNFRSADHDCP